MRKTTFKEFIEAGEKKYKDIKEEFVRIEGVKIYPVFLLYSVTIIILAKICQIIF